MKSFAIIVLLCVTSQSSPTREQSLQALEGFRDGIAHWRRPREGNNYPRYHPDNVTEIADNLLLMQRANGGWPKDRDPTQIFTPEERRDFERNRSRADASFDNRNTYSQIEYLAFANSFFPDERYRRAAIEGLEYTLSAQYEHGGFPHSFPDKKGYHPHVTIVDDVMVGVLRTLREAAGVGPRQGSDRFAFLPTALRQRCRGAFERGDLCLLTLQVRVNGVLTGWASQYDERTLEPCAGRSFELPALISAETVGVLRYLMEINSPSTEVQRAIESGVQWLKRSQINGLRIERVSAPEVKYAYHTSREDVVAVPDPTAPPLWARFYEIDSNRPFMANRDGKKVYQLSEVERERRTGYSWYGTYARELIDRDYPKWKQRWLPSTQGLHGSKKEATISSD